jgi:mono/diheme cytochrome c family protein
MKRQTAVLVAVAMMMCAAAMAQNGAEPLFNANCAKCHGADGKGSKTTKMHPADLQSKAVQAMTDEQLYESIAVGVHHKEYPHAYLNRGLMREQVQELVKYIRTLGKKS